MICRFFVPPDPAHGRKLLTLRILAANENAPLAAVSRPQPRDNGADARRPSFERARIQDICARIGASRLDAPAGSATRNLNAAGRNRASAVRG